MFEAPMLLDFIPQGSIPLLMERPAKAKSTNVGRIAPEISTAPRRLGVSYEPS